MLKKKRKLVEELVALSVGDPVRKHPPGAADLFNEIDEKIRQRMREIKILKLFLTAVFAMKNLQTLGK